MDRLTNGPTNQHGKEQKTITKTKQKKVEMIDKQMKKITLPKIFEAKQNDDHAYVTKLRDGDALMI